MSYLLVLAVAAGASFLTTPIVKRMVTRLGAVDVPDDRKVHSTPTPTLGGLAIFAGVLAGMAAAWAMPHFRQLFTTSSEPIGVLFAGAAMVMLGTIDDTRGMKASTKLAGQVAGSGILILAGVQVFYFWLPGPGLISLSSDMSALITVAWTIVVINAVT